MINPNDITTVRVGQLPNQAFNLTDLIPHEVGSNLKSGTIQDLADFLAAYIGVSSSIAFNPVTVLDGGTLPNTTTEEWILVGQGTFTNVGGGATITTTEELNALVSNGTYWSIGVQIPINVELAGITQLIRSGFTNTTPSEDALFNALALKQDVSTSGVNSIGWFMYNDLATQTTPIPFVTNVDKKLTNDALGAGTQSTYAPFGVSSIWDSGVTNQLNLSQLSVGDIVNMRVVAEVTTTSANQTYEIKFKSAIGSPVEQYTSFLNGATKTASTKTQAISVQVAVSSTYARDFPSEFWIVSDGNGSIKIKGFFFSVLRRGLNLVQINEDANKISTVIVTGTSHALTDTDNAKQIITTNASPVTITAGTGLMSGFNCSVLQQGSGKVTVVASGTTLQYTSFELPSTIEQNTLLYIDDVPNLTETYHVYGQLTKI